MEDVRVSQQFQDDLDSLLIRDDDILLRYDGGARTSTAVWRTYTLVTCTTDGRIVYENKDAPHLAVSAAKRILGVG